MALLSIKARHRTNLIEINLLNRYIYIYICKHNSKFLSSDMCLLFFQELEDLLPTRADPPLISGDAEEVEMMEFVSQSSSGGQRREAYNDSSDEEGGHHGPGVQCAHQ